MERDGSTCLDSPMLAVPDSVDQVWNMDGGHESRGRRIRHVERNGEVVIELRRR